MINLYDVSQRLIIHEGLRLQPYFCSKGKLTIGVGRCLETNPMTAEEEKVVGDWKHGITRNAAIYLLRNDIKNIYRALKKYLDFFDKLDAERQYALIDMAFNIGVHGLLKFKKMLKAMRKSDYDKAAEECLNSRYAETVGIRAKRIAATIKTGVFKL